LILASLCSKIYWLDQFGWKPSLGKYAAILFYFDYQSVKISVPHFNSSSMNCAEILSKARFYMLVQQRESSMYFFMCILICAFCKQ
jgi:hypothetical protein